MRLIDADALEVFVKTVRQGLYLDKTLSDIPTRDSMLLNFQQYVHLQPTISAVPVVRGEWRQGKEFSTYPRVPFISTAYYCSNCEGEAYWDTDYGQQLFGFCPNCGAKMEEHHD